MPRALNALKPKRLVRWAHKELDKIDPEWHRYEVKMNELAVQTVRYRVGEPINKYLIRLYMEAKKPARWHCPLCGGTGTIPNKAYFLTDTEGKPYG